VCLGPSPNYPTSLRVRTGVPWRIIQRANRVHRPRTVSRDTHRKSTGQHTKLGRATKTGDGRQDRTESRKRTPLVPKSSQLSVDPLFIRIGRVPEVPSAAGRRPPIAFPPASPWALREPLFSPDVSRQPPVIRCRHLREQAARSFPI
jgi:hypothetical protein